MRASKVCRAMFHTTVDRLKRHDLDQILVAEQRLISLMVDLSIKCRYFVTYPLVVCRLPLN